MGSKARHRTAAALLVVASLLAFVSLFAVWINRQVLNTDNWTTTSSELLADPVIRDQVGVFLVNELYSNVDVTAQIQAALPDRFKPFAAPAAGALRNFAERAAKDILARPRAQEAWEQANRRAHLQLLKVLDGGGTTVSTEGGTVVLDLKSLLDQLEQRVGIGGRVAAALPAGAAQITILHSDELSQAQDLAQLLRGLPLILVGSSLLLFGIALLIAPRSRRTTVRGYGIGLIVAGVAMLVTISVAGDALVNALANTAAMEPVVAHVWTTVTPLLKEATGATIGYGLVMVIGAWLAGPTRPAFAIRRALAPYLREPLIAYAGLAVILAVVVFWWAPTPATRNPATAILLVALLALGFEGLRRHTAREFPEASREAALRAHGERIGRLRDRLRDGGGWAGDKAVAVHQGPTTPAPEARLEGLERLGRLRDAGVLDADEFRVQKAQLLSDAEPLENGAPTAPLPGGSAG
jgi:hypothetical protein